MDELIAAVNELLDSVPGGYVSKAKVRALLDRRAAAGDGHEDHLTLLVGTSLVCGCGKDLGVTCVALPADPSQIEQAYWAATSAYVDKLREIRDGQDGGVDQPAALNVCVAAAVDAALGVYGIQEAP